MSEATLRLNRGTQPRQHDRAGAKRKLIGHEFMLQKMKDDKVEVEIEKLNGTLVTGVVTNFDKYTVTIDESGIGETCIFKHAIAQFHKGA